MSTTFHSTCHRLCVVALMLVAHESANAQAKDGFEFLQKPAEKKVDVMVKGRVVTSYIYPDSLMKPVLYPLQSASGINVMREYPMTIKAGERADHPHHVGLFLTHQSVNGFDFWNMSTAIAPARREKYGKIIHNRVVSAVGGEQGTLVVSATWKSYAGEPQLEETTTFTFRMTNTDFIIDRSTELKALREVVFKDMKDAFMAMRLARELEQPSDAKDRFVKADGTLTEPMLNSEGATGLYRSSAGEKGDSVWGKRAAWVCIDGKKEGRKISIAILDHPSNVEYPSYWHTRGYGLFSINPLGREVFTEGKSSLNLTLKKGEAVTFRYRVLFHEGEPPSKEELDKMGKNLTASFK